MLNQNIGNVMDKKQLVVKRAIGICSFLVFIVIAGFIAIFLYKNFDFRNPQEFREQIESYGWAAWLVALGIQILQVVIALIPGEAVEIGVGYAFGAIGGTLICLIGVTIASTIIFLLTKKWGIKFVELFVKREKIDGMRGMRGEKKISKLKRIVFILYFIPGTPKDLLTYVAGLTKIKLTDFLLISGIARLPSIVSSTVGGKYLAENNYKAAIIVFSVTAVVSIAGLLIYNAITKNKNVCDKIENDTPQDDIETDDDVPEDKND